MKKSLVVTMFIAVLGCTPTQMTPTQGTPSVITVTPASAELEVGDSQQFTSSDPSTWSIQEGSVGGTITSTGLYTAPITTGIYHVVATTADSRTGKSVVKVRKTVVSVSPSPASVTAGGTVQFTATVTGPTDTSVSWSVQEAGGGSINAAGLYSATLNPGTYHVVATSNANVKKSATTAIAVGAPITITVSPATSKVDACSGASVQFTAAFTGTADTRTAWSVQEANGGTVTTTGLYTKPADGSVGTFHVIATSLADTSKVVMATVTVAERVLGVSVSPPTVTLQPNGTQQFSATVTTTCGAFISTAQTFSVNSRTYLMVTEKKVSTLYEVVNGQQVLVGQTRQQ